MGGEGLEELLVDCGVDEVVGDAVGFGEGGEVAGGEGEAELAFAGGEIGKGDLRDALGVGVEFTEEVAGEDLGIGVVEGGGGGGPAVFGGAGEVGARGEGEEEDDDVDESGEEEGEDVAAGGRGDEFREGEEEFFLAGGGLVEVVREGGDGGLHRAGGVELEFEFGPGDRVVDFAEAADLLV